MRARRGRSHLDIAMPAPSDTSEPLPAKLTAAVTSCLGGALATLRLAGRLDGAVAPTLTAALAGVMGTALTALLVELADVTDYDTDGVTALVGRRRDASPQSPRLADQRLRRGAFRAHCSRRNTTLDDRALHPSGAAAEQGLLCCGVNLLRSALGPVRRSGGWRVRTTSRRAVDDRATHGQRPRAGCCPGDAPRHAAACTPDGR